MWTRTETHTLYLMHLITHTHTDGDGEREREREKDHTICIFILFADALLFFSDTHYVGIGILWSLLVSSIGII